MSDNAAKIHSHSSNRATAKQALERKPVFKSTLQNPFQIRWPSVPVNLQNSAFSLLLLSLEAVSTFHSARDAANRKRKRNLRTQTSASKRTKENSSVTIRSPQVEESDVEDNIQHPPDILSHLTIGINQVTKKLEAQARAYRETVDTKGAVDVPKPVPICIVFVCRADVDPPLLIAHLPSLIASCNSSRRSIVDPEKFPPIKLIPLPLGSEMALAEATALRRLSIIALDADTPQIDSFNSLFHSVPILRASWLSQTEVQVTDTAKKPEITSLLPTHIKQLLTTAPKDMKTAKAQRTSGRTEAKERRRSQKR